MDPSLYRAAMEGKVDFLMQYNIHQLEVQVTPNNNTLLHVAAQFGHLQCVAEILGKCRMLLHKVNNNGDTPLHIAAREGHSQMVKAFIETAKELDLESGGGAAAKELMRATNHIDKDTALHMAVRSQQYNLEVVKLLTSEDPEFQHPPNNAEETPLYLAAERGGSHGSLAVSEILETCTSPAYGGPGGRTALHAAAISHSEESMKKLLDWKQDLIKEADAHGWTPLHYAARCRNVIGVRLLLKMDKSVAYITTTEEKDDNKTALHIAATVGAVDVMAEILSHCPDTWEMVNSKGQNALHIAVETQEIDAIRFMLEQSWSSHLINQKDNIEGNTPFHLVGPDASYLYGGLPELKFHNRAVWKDAFNNKNLTPRDVEMSADYEDYFFEWPIGGGRNIVNNDRQMLSNIDKYRERRKEAKEAKERRREETKKKSKEQRKAVTENYRKMAETHLIVATLIATVTFAAGFTLPGGYDGEKGPDKGMAVLVREAAFKAFVITNTIAVICSISSAFLNVTASLYYDEEDDKMGNRYLAAFFLILIAMGAMMVAFITGAYAVLSHSLGLAISTCVVGCLSFLIYFLELKNLVVNISKE